MATHREIPDLHYTARVLGAFMVWLYRNYWQRHYQAMAAEYCDCPESLSLERVSQYHQTFLSQFQPTDHPHRLFLL